MFLWQLVTGRINSAKYQKFSNKPLIITISYKFPIKLNTDDSLEAGSIVITNLITTTKDQIRLVVCFRELKWSACQVRLMSLLITIFPSPHCPCICVFISNFTRILNVLEIFQPGVCGLFRLRVLIISCASFLKPSINPIFDFLPLVAGFFCFFYHLELLI